MALSAVQIPLVETLIGGNVATILIRRGSPEVAPPLVIIVGTVTTLKLTLKT
ncbi:MAG TPA: hypothetical protein VMU98_08935 [Acidimicrobiales bacterium]|nr:hypothetical protein [Acidimicrobiales bacterium]